MASELTSRTLRERDAIASPSTGEVVFNSTARTLSVYDGSGWVDYERVELSKQTGLDIPERDLATGTNVVTLGKDQLYWRLFVPQQDIVVTAAAMASTATTSAGLTLAKYGLYHIGRTLNTDVTEMSFMPLAKTASDTTMFNSANTLYQKSWDTTGGWPSAVRLVRSERYAVSYLIAGTTAPTVVSSAAFMRAQSNGSTVFPIIGGTFGGLGTLTEIPDYVNGTSWSYSGAGPGPWYNLPADPQSTLRRPYATALLGDSYFISYGGWFGVANAQAASRLLPTLNAGVGGEQTSQMLARISTVLAARPQVVVLHGGINDVAATRSASAIQADITSIITAVLATGARVIVCTVPPSTSMDAGELTTLAAVNTWIKAITTSGVYVADTGNALTTGDGVTRDAAKYVDGAHPNLTGRQAMADVLDDVIATVVAALGG
jgi:lysophospholipase L1-like esterase